MNTEKNISVMLSAPEKNKNSNELVISFSSTFRNLKAFFLAWLVIAAVIAMMLTGVMMLMKKSVSSSTVSALINFDYDGIEWGAAPDGTKLDVSKIKSPNVIESALSDLGIPLGSVEIIRDSISIEGVIPSDAKDRLNLYKGSILSGGAVSPDTVEMIINSSSYPSYYIIEFNYGRAGFDVSGGKQVLDGILKSYREYFFASYGYNEALGSAVVAIDYTEYDYPAAIDVFETTLDNLEKYVNKLSEENPDFRSGKTGHSLEDVKDRIEIIKNADLNTLLSYVSVNNVTNDKSMLLNYYQYKIDELTRYKEVWQAELDTYRNSINNYDKSSVILMGQDFYDDEYFDMEDDEEDVEEDTSEDDEDEKNKKENAFLLSSKKYDELVKSQIAKQQELSECKEKIDYYNNRVVALKNNTGNVTDKSIKETESRLASLNTRINNLISIVNRTVDEYYGNVTYGHSYNILVPAVGSEPWVETKEVLLPVIIAEAALFAVYLLTAFIYAIVSDTNAKKEKDEKENDNADNEN